jgi:hypothetical protein
MVRLLMSAALFWWLLVAGLQTSNAHAADFKAEKLEGGTVVIWVSGEIENGDEIAFRRLSVEHEEAIVILDSAGGKLMPAIEIGKIIRLAGYATMVGDDFVCTSSCALIWLAGDPRYLEPQGKVGFHASYRDNEGKLEETGVGNAIIGHYLSLLNLPQRAVVFATTASPAEITWLTDNNTRQSGIDYRTIGDQSEKKSASTPEVLTTSPSMRSITPPPAIRTVSTPPPLVKTIMPPQRAMADYSLDEFKVTFRRLFRDSNYLQTAFASMNLGTDGLATMLDHAKILYADERYIDRLVSELHQAREGLSGGDDDRAIGMSIGQATNIKLTLNGLSRLSDRDVKLYLSYINSIILRASDAECKAILTGKDEFGRTEMRLLTELGKQSFADYLALTRRAIIAELSNSPLQIVPSKVEVDAGQKSFENYLTQQLAQLPKLEQDRLNAAIAALNDANDKDSCDGYYMIFKSAIELGGMPGNWLRRDMVNSMGE